jgi:hypothetical protein
MQHIEKHHARIVHEFQQIAMVIPLQPLQEWYQRLHWREPEQSDCTGTSPVNFRHSNDKIWAQYWQATVAESMHTSWIVLMILRHNSLVMHSSACLLCAMPQVTWDTAFRMYSSTQQSTLALQTRGRPQLLTNRHQFGILPHANSCATSGMRNALLLAPPLNAVLTILAC